MSGIFDFLFADLGVAVVRIRAQYLKAANCKILLRLSIGIEIQLTYYFLPNKVML